MFCVKPSRLPDNAGLGLFSMSALQKNTLVRCNHSKATTDDESNDCEVLAFSVPRGVDRAAACVWNGTVTSFSEVWPLLKESVFEPAYVHMARHEYPMRANDLAWRAGMRRAAYKSVEERRNQLELILGFENGELDCVYLWVKCRVTRPDTELGISYGTSYWWSESPF